jgi:hypothetical protein
MRPEDLPPLDDQLTFLLAACDEALGAGLPPAALDDPAVPVELRARLEREVAWYRRVRQLMGRPGPVTAQGPATLPLLRSTSDEGTPARLGRFEVRRELGRGSFGVVFLAYDPQLRREVALKVPRPEALLTPELRARFRQEAQAAAGLEHPNLVPVYEAGEQGPLCFIASAYCPGVTLAAWLKQRGEPVPVETAARLVAALAEAVEHAHRRGVLHRDLKPSNILLASPADPAATDLSPRITDFGLAKLVEDGSGATLAGCPTQTGAVLGTPRYMAPEQADGRSKAVGPAADIYALGVLLYEVLTGRPPFQADTALDTLWLVRTQEPLAPGRLRPGLPRDLETICLKCLHKEPGWRYASARALADDLGRFLRHEPIHARRAGPLGRLARWGRRNPTLAITITLAGALVGLAAGLGITGVLRERDRYHAEQQKAVANLYQSLVGEARGYAAGAGQRLPRPHLGTPGAGPGPGDARPRPAGAPPASGGVPGRLRGSRAGRVDQAGGRVVRGPGPGPRRHSGSSGHHRRQRCPAPSSRRRGGRAAARPSSWCLRRRLRPGGQGAGVGRPPRRDQGVGPAAPRRLGVPADPHDRPFRRARHGPRPLALPGSRRPAALRLRQGRPGRHVLGPGR